MCTWIIRTNGDVIFDEKDVNGLPEKKKYFFGKFIASHVLDLTSLFRASCSGECEDRSLSFRYPEEATRHTKNQTSQIFSSEAPAGSQAENSSERNFHPATEEITEARTEKRPAELTAEEERKRERRAASKLDESLTALYRALLKPARQFVEGSQVVVVPDGALALVPFAALKDEKGCYVAESLQIRLVPSLKTAKIISEKLQEPEGQASPLIIGDPDLDGDDNGEFTAPRLPKANKEARMIGRLLSVEPLTGEKATKETFLQRVGSANLIHIAAHGDIERGEILLGPRPGMDKNNLKEEDVMVTLTDLEHKRLSAKLVVLSCAHSARGKVMAEGIVGIARAFLGAGARAVLASLWALRDDASFFFMKKFYKNLVDGESASEALHRAMKAMREHKTNKAFRHPHCWAPFVLIGENVTL